MSWHISNIKTLPELSLSFEPYLLLKTFFFLFSWCFWCNVVHIRRVFYLWGLISKESYALKVWISFLKINILSCSDSLYCLFSNVHQTFLEKGSFRKENPQWEIFFLFICWEQILSFLIRCLLLREANIFLSELPLEQVYPFSSRLTRIIIDLACQKLTLLLTFDWPFWFACEFFFPQFIARVCSLFQHINKLNDMGTRIKLFVSSCKYRISP